VGVTSALFGGEWSNSRPSRFTPEEGISDVNGVGGWMGPRASLAYIEKGTFLILPRLELRPLGRPSCSQSLYRLREKRNAYRILVGKAEGKRPLGRRRLKWADNIKMELRGI
jgi:hypothetical protein